MHGFSSIAVWDSILVHAGFLPNKEGYSSALPHSLDFL